jgi:hypothetical protein
MPRSRGWTYVTAVVALVTAVVLADMRLHSQPTERSVSQRALDSSQPYSAKANRIYGSDASNSTYGLDSARTIDW